MAAMIKAALLSHLSRAIRIPLSYSFDKAIHLTQIHTLLIFCSTEWLIERFLKIEK
jgi:hypothetical protein